MDGFGGGGGRFTITPTLGDGIAPNPIITYNGGGGGGFNWDDMWGGLWGALKGAPWKDIFSGVGALGTAAAPFMKEIFSDDASRNQMRPGTTFDGIPPLMPQEEREPFDFGELFAGFGEQMAGQQKLMQEQAEAQKAQFEEQQKELETQMLEEKQKATAQEAAAHRADFQARTGSALSLDLAALEMGIPLEELMAALQAFGADYGWDIGGIV